MKQFLKFQEMITPSLVTFLFILGVIAITLSTISTMAAYNSGFLGFILTVTGAVFSIIFLRIMLELMVVVFKIHENLKTLVAAQDNQDYYRSQ